MKSVKINFSHASLCLRPNSQVEQEWGINMSIQELLTQFGDKYLQALLTTYKLTVLAFIFAVIIGIIITVMRISPIKPLRAAADFYVQVFRNIPGAALLILLVYALPYLNVVLSYYLCVLIAITLIPSAFCSEYLMAGMNTISPGQIDRLLAEGFTHEEIEECLYSREV